MNSHEREDVNECIRWGFPPGERLDESVYGYKGQNELEKMGSIVTTGADGHVKNNKNIKPVDWLETPDSTFPMWTKEGGVNIAGSDIHQAITCQMRKIKQFINGCLSKVTGEDIQNVWHDQQF